MSKKCTKCGEVKGFSEFGIRKSNKDGLRYQCRDCIKKTAQSRKYDLTCQNPDCEKEFTHCRKVKYCPECRPPRTTQEGVIQGNKRCSRCGLEKKICEFKNRKSSSDGKEGRCRKCMGNSRKKTYLTMSKT